MRVAGPLAGLAALLTLVVVAASAAIRLGADELGSTLAIARGVHRTAASLAALLVLALFWRVLRFAALRQATSTALVLMLALAAVGWATGTRPPPAAALFNPLGGVALAALLAWIAGRAGGGTVRPAADRSLAHAGLMLASLQLAFGALLAWGGLGAALILLIAHAVLGFATAATGAALGARLCGTGDARRGSLLFFCAALVPLAGVLSVLPTAAVVVRIGHATAAALLLAAIALAHGRVTRSA